MIALEPRSEPSRLMLVLSPVIAIVLMLVASALLLWFFSLGGERKFDVAKGLYIYFFQPVHEAWLWAVSPGARAAHSYMPAEVLVKATPLALIGAGLAISFRANVWNIGAAGQYTLGAILSGAVALHAPAGAAGWHWMALYMAAGIAGGMLWAAIPAYLRTRFNSNEILTSLMLAYVAGFLLDWLVRGPWIDPAGRGFPESADYRDAFLLAPLVGGTRLHAGIVMAGGLALLLGVMMARTLKGFEIRVMGDAPRAGAFAGFSRNGTIWFVLLLSGGLAGLAGAIEVAGTLQQLQPEITASYGFSAIIVAFLGRLNPVGAVFAALVLAITFIGSENAQISLKLPKNVAGLFQGMLLFFLLACDTLTRYRIRLARTEAA